jgi:hypothetical protein
MPETTQPYSLAALRVPAPARSAVDLVDRRTCRVNESRADGLPVWAPLAQRTMQPWAMRTHRPKVERLPQPVQLAPESMASERPHPFDVAAMDEAALLVAVVGCARETALNGSAQPVLSLAFPDSVLMTWSKWRASRKRRRRAFLPHVN